MAKEVSEEYKSSLEDLKFNSKPLINMLTMLADENSKYSTEIAAVIEDHLGKAPSDKKLPVLYLLDSILKNIKDANYVKLFSKNIIRMFSGVFHKVNEKTRSSMWKLRETWDDYIPLQILYNLDLEIAKIDKAWPIKKPPKENISIHVNPHFKQPIGKPEPAIIRMISNDKKIDNRNKPVENTHKLDHRPKLIENLSENEKLIAKLQKKQVLLELEEAKLKLSSLKSDKHESKSSKKILQGSGGSKISSKTSKSSSHNSKSNSSKHNDFEDSQTSKSPQNKIVPKKSSSKHSLHSSSRSGATKSSSSTSLSSKRKSPKDKKSRSDKKAKISLVDDIIMSESIPIKVLNSSNESNTSDSKVGRNTSKYRGRHHSDDDEEDVEEHFITPDKRISIANLPRISKIRRTNESSSNIADSRNYEMAHPPSDLHLDDELSPQSAVLPSPKTQEWTRFKKSRPSDFPFSQPRRISEDSHLQDIDYRLEQVSSERIPTSEMPIYNNAESRARLQSRNASSIPRYTSRSNSISNDDYVSLIDDMQRELNNPNINNINKEEIAKKLNRLIEVRKLRIDVDNRRTSMVISGGLSTSVASVKPPSDNFHPNNDTNKQNLGLIQKLNKRNENPQQINSMDKLICVQDPWYDINKNYAFEHDSRWAIRLNSSDNGRQICVPGPKFGETIIDGVTYAMSADLTPRYINLSKLNQDPNKTKYSILITVDMKQRCLLIDQEHSRYRFGDDPIDVVLCDGRKHHIFFRGIIQRIWINGDLFELSIDAPKEIYDFYGHKIRLSIESAHGNKPLAILVNDQYIYKSRDDNGPYDLVLGTNIYDVYFKQPSKEVVIAGNPMKIDFNGPFPVCIGQDGISYGIRFDDIGFRVININDEDCNIPINRPTKIYLQGRPYFISLGGPGHEIIMNERYYSAKFEGPSITIRQGAHNFKIKLRGKAPLVKVLGRVTSLEEIIRIFGNPKRNIQHKRQFGHYNDSLAPQYRPNNHRQPYDNAYRLQRKPYHNDVRPPYPVPNKGDMVNKKCLLPTPPSNPSPNANYQLPRYEEQLPSQNALSSDVRLPISDIIVTPTLPRITPSLPLNIQVSTESRNMLPPTSVPVQREVNMNFNNSLGPPPSSNNNVTSTVTDPSKLSIEALMSKLLNAGILHKSADAPSLPPASNDNEISESVTKKSTHKKKEQIVPDLTEFIIDKLRVHYDSVVENLYLGMQCKMCGIRFEDTESDIYSEHLDWHFRQNRLEKDQKYSRFRKWYYSEEDWVKYTEICDMKEHGHSSYFDSLVQQELTNEETQRQLAEQQMLQQPTLINCPIALGIDLDICAICGDQFDQFWDEDEEEWHLKDALRDGDLTYHPICYDDAKLNMLEESLIEDEVPVEPSESKEELDIETVTSPPTTTATKDSSLPDPITDPLGYLEMINKQSSDALLIKSSDKPSSPVKEELSSSSSGAEDSGKGTPTCDEANDNNTVEVLSIVRSRLLKNKHFPNGNNDVS